MSKIEQLSQIFAEHVAVGWPEASSGAQRLVSVIYDPAEERILRAKLTLFQIAAERAGYSWRTVDIANFFGEWMKMLPYRDEYYSDVDALYDIAEDRFAAFVAERLIQALGQNHHARELLAVVGVGALFGLTSISDVLMRVDRHVRGRLIVFFPGRFRNDRFRLFDARESWNYHSVAIHVD